MEDKKILAIIGAGEAAFPIISKAKIMDVFTIAFGQNDSLAKDLVDKFIECDIFNIEYIYQCCLKNGVNGVIASSEVSTEVAAIVADRLSLPGNDVKDGFAGRNKYLMRCKVQHLTTVKQPKFELYKETSSYTFPIVVKSLDSCGKRGVSLVKNNDEFQKAVKYAQEYSTNGEVLIEEYLEGGQEYSIECLCNGLDVYIVQYTQKDSTGAPHFVEIGHHQPAQLSDDEKCKVDVAVIDILHRLGLCCGMAHVELKIINNEVYFIEVGARAGGGHIGDVLVALSTNVDYYKGAIECSLGTFNPINICNKSYAGIYFYCKQTEPLMKLFDISYKSSWCIDYHFTPHELYDVTCSIDRMNSGYIIYNANQKIDIHNCQDCNDIIPVEVNLLPNAYQLVWDHCKEIGRELTNEELDLGIKKFFNLGHILAILKNNHIVAFLVLYCYDKESLNGYICNVYVLEQYRGLGYSVKLIEKAFEICKEAGFKTVSLHVQESNIRAVSIYERLGFRVTSNKKNKGLIEMKYFL